VLVLSLGLPVWQLAAETRTWRELGGALAAGREALWNSFFFAAVTATLVCALGVLSRRWQIGGLMWALFLLPGVLLGIGLILLVNRPVTAWFYQSAGVVFLALGLRYLAIGRSGAARAFAGVDRDLTESARLAGAGGWRLFREVHWPQVAGPLLAAWYAVYLLCLWDVESVVLVVPPGGETLALRIFNLLHYGHNAQVNALCVALMGLAVAPLVLAGVWRTTFNSGGNSKSQVPSSKEIPNSKLQTLQARCSGWAVGIFLLTGCTPMERADDGALESRLFSRVEIIGTRGAGAGQFNKPRSLALDREDNLYVVDMTARVQKFSPDGRYLGAYQFELTDLGRPKGMGRDAEGNIVVVEPHYKRVNHLSPELRLVKQWGVSGTNTGQLAFPRSAAVNARGEIYVSEYMYVERVQRFEKPGGRLLGVFGEAGQGDGQFNRPEGLGVDSQGHVYVADSCNHRVQVFTGEGKFLRTYGKAGGGMGDLSYPYDVQIDATGLQFVCEFGNSRVQVFDANDRPVEILGGRDGGARLATPWASALDSKGNLYVADAGNHRVVKYVRKENSKSQAPASKKTPSAKFQRASRARQNVVLGAWSFLGTWSLEFGTWNCLEVFQ
jgi:ABC-type spermidine/putrescine transport system permease subunit II/sugar lactone lactonase YvrE